MLIRKATLDDAEAINNIYNQGVAAGQTADIAPITIAQRITWLENHNEHTHPVFVAETDGRVVGWLSFSPYRPGRMALRYAAEISYYLDQAWQRQGIGSRLIAFALQVAPQFGFKHLIGIILDNNLPSISLLARAGFSKWAHLPNIAEFDDVICGHIYYGITLAEPTS